MALEQLLEAHISTHKQKAEGSLGMKRGFRCFRACHCGIPPPTKSHVLILPKEFDHWGPSTQTHEPMGVIHIKKTAYMASFCKWEIGKEKKEKGKIRVMRLVKWVNHS